MVSLGMILDAKKTLNDIARVTPLVPAPRIGENIYIKAESLQLTGSFKLRGAYYKINSLTEEEKAKGIIACSAGNHAQGIALSATKANTKSVICMPRSAPLSKIEATKNYGAEVVLVPGVYDDAYKKAMELAEEHGYTFAHPFDDERIIAGQGTIGLEILEQLPEVDVVVVPIGGGGLISGVAYAIKSIVPECIVIGVQAEGAASMLTSMNNNGVTELPSVSTIADGIAVKKPGTLTFQLCRKYVDDIITVTDDEIASAILQLMEGEKTVAEGAGATAVAAVMSGKIDTKNKNVVCVVSGGNIDVTILSKVINRALTTSGRIVEISTKVIDRPGELIVLLQLIAELGSNVITVNVERKNQKTEISACIVTMVIETKNLTHVEEIKSKLAENGYEILDLF